MYTKSLNIYTGLLIFFTIQDLTILQLSLNVPFAYSLIRFPIYEESSTQKTSQKLENIFSIYSDNPGQSLSSSSQLTIVCLKYKPSYQLLFIQIKLTDENLQNYLSINLVNTGRLVSVRVTNH